MAERVKIVIQATGKIPEGVDGADLRLRIKQGVDEALTAKLLTFEGSSVVLAPADSFESEA